MKKSSDEEMLAEKKPGDTTETVLQDLGLLQLLSLVLSILILVGLGVESLATLSPAATALLDRIDFVVCLVFLFDFCNRFAAASSKVEFMKWGWIDLVSSLPVAGYLQWGRIARVLRILRVLRVFRSASVVWQYVVHNRPKATLKAAFLLAVIAFIFGSIAILEVEDTAAANITTPDDGLWWAFTTMITVGCEKYPVTPCGRMIGGLLSLVGVGLTGVYTAYVASFFISAPSSSADSGKILEELRSLNAQLKGMPTREKNPEA